MFVYRVDESRWPLAIFESPGARPPSGVDADRFYTELDRLLAKGERFATLHDLRGTRPDAKRRRRFTDWTTANHATLQSRLAAHAVVVDSTFLRGIITAVLWMTTPPCPMKVFDDRLEAERWLLAELARRA
jgi:hypothetical protein